MALLFFYWLHGHFERRARARGRVLGKPGAQGAAALLVTIEVQLAESVPVAEDGAHGLALHALNTSYMNTLLTFD